MSVSNTFDLHTTPAVWEQRQESLLLEMKQKWDDLIYKEQVNQLWKLGMESMMHSVWAKVCSECVTRSVSCQTDEEPEQIHDTSSPECLSCVNGTIADPPDDESCFLSNAEDDNEHNSEGDVESVPVGSLSVAENESSPSVLVGAQHEEQSEVDSISRSQNVEWNQCTHCETKFSTKDAFLRHQKRFHLKCSKRHYLRVLKHRGVLSTHINRRTCQRLKGPSNFDCLECGSSFITYGKLRYHLRIHRPNKFLCTICDKTFTYQSNLKCHMLCHTHRCNICSKRFSSKSSCQKHVMTQHPK